MTNPQADSSNKTSRRLSFSASERKKIVVIAALGAVCLVIAIAQVWKKKGPATAEGATPSTATATVNLDDVLTQMRSTDRQPEAASEKKALCRTVDEAMELFLGDVKGAAMPPDKVRRSTFGLPEEPAKAGPALAAGSAKQLAAGKEPSEAADPVLSELGKLSLETVLLSARNRTAIINGQVFHCGEWVGEFMITEIEPGRVSLQRAGKTYALTLK